MRSGRRKWWLWLSLLAFLWVLLCNCNCVGAGAGGEAVIVKVGVVLDLNSTVGQMSKTAIQLALSDFYTANPKYKTRLSLLFKDAGDVVEAASAGMELLGDDQVEAIIGPQTSEQAAFMAEFGKKYEIPVMSFSATSPSLSPSPYFTRPAQSDSAQVEAINAVIQTYGWREIVPIYEDAQFGHGIIPYLADALQLKGTRFGCRVIIPTSATDPEISRQLRRVRDMRKRIFLLHVTAPVGSKVFTVAQTEGMMGQGYAWIVTDALSSMLDPTTDSQALDSMQGIVGVRPRMPHTEKLQHFQTRFNKLLPLSSGVHNNPSVNVFAVWAYDTVWALGMAVEKVKSNGKRLADAVANTRFEGISGDFHLVKGELKRKGASFEVFNVVGEKERIIGYWNPTHNEDEQEGVVMTTMKQPIWPGDVNKTPPMNLTIGIPVKPGFTEFIQVDKQDPKKSSGFCIDVFKSAIEVLHLPIDYRFVPFANESGESNGTYDELLLQIGDHKMDAVVGDITIIANRSEFVDFTLPYSESGVSMLVSMTSDGKKNMWIFLRPFKWDLWLLSFVSFVFTGSVVWLLECSVNTDFGTGPPQQQIGFIFWFSFSTLVFAHRERILNNLSRFLLIIWVFVVLILTQSYTANLSSMLTAQRLKPLFADANEIREKGYFVGFQNGSFVKELLITQLGFNETKLRSYRSPDEFEHALTSGTDNGGVAAIFDEIPYIKVFLSKYRSGFQMVGPIYRTGGFGFAFPKGSPLVPYFSKAILDVTEDQNKMTPIEQKYFSNRNVQIADPDDSRLDAYSFCGLFSITAVATFSSLFIYLTQFFHSHWPDSSTVHSDSPLTAKMVEMGKLFYDKHFRSSSLQTSDSRVHPEITETTTPQTDPDHSNSTEQPQNLSVVNEDQTLAREHNTQFIATN